MKLTRPLLVMFLLPLGVAMAAPMPTAQEPLTLMQTLERAVGGNVDLRRERVTIQIADAGLLRAQGQFDFVFTGSLSFQRSTTPPLTAEDIASGFTNDLGFDFGLQRNLETGGSVRFSLQNDLFNTNSRFQCGTPTGAPSTCNYYNAVLGLNFTHPLLQGFGAEVTQANVRRQRIQKDMALLNRQMRAANVLRDVITTYWELAYSTRNLEIRRSAVELAQEQLRITKAQIEVGRLAPVDAAAVEQAIGARMQDVVVSEQELFFRTMDLRRLLGAPSDPSQPPFAAVELPTASPRDVDVASEVSRALETNPQLRSIKMGLQLTQIDIQTASETVRPRLDFVGNVGSRGRKSNYADTLSQTVGLDDMTWSAALNLQMPIENRTGKGSVWAAQLGAEGARLDAGMLELDIRDRVIRLASNVSTASRRVELSKQTVGFAQQNLEAEKARFSVGRSTNNEVLRLQQGLKEAEIQVVRSTVDLLNSEAQLSAITTEVLDRYGVVLKGL